MMIVNFTPCSTRAFSDALDGVAIKRSYGGKPPDPIFSPSSSTQRPVLCSAMVGLSAFILRGVTGIHMLLCHIPGLTKTWHQSSEIFIVGKVYVLSSVYYCCIDSLLNVSSQYACNFRWAVASVAGQKPLTPLHESVKATLLPDAMVAM